MIFTFLLGLTALFVAGCAAYFSVLGIATLFAGSFLQVAIMASSLELGKLVATSFLYRYWNKTALLLKVYLISAIVILMGITSLGIFGYLSAAYQINSTKFAQIDSQIEIIEQQKLSLDEQLKQLQQRISTLNDVRAIQEQRVQDAGNYRVPREQAYAAIKAANDEIILLTEKTQTLQNAKFEKDNQIVVLKSEYTKTKDIGTFRFIAEALKGPLDTVVIVFIAILICVFDPLAVCLVLAFNIAVGGKILKEAEQKPLKEHNLLSQVVFDQEPPKEKESISPKQENIKAVGHFRKKN